MIARLHSEAGAALTDALIGVAILAVALVVFLSGISTGSITTSSSDNRSTAHQLARSQLEYVKTLPYQPAGTDYPTVTPPPGFEVNSPALAIAEGDADIQRIAVEVLQDGAVVYTLEGYRTDR
jgi:hypothetical protein